MSHRLFPRVRRYRRGYHCRQVEAFLAGAENSATGAQPELVAADVRRVGFELVRHGYVPSAVDTHLDALEDRLVAAQDVAGGGRRGVSDSSSDLLFLRNELVAVPYMRRFPRAGRLRRGYNFDDVDEFLDRLAETLGGGAAVSVDDVRRVAFRPKRGGYAEAAVDDTLDRMIEALLVLRRTTSQVDLTDTTLAPPAPPTGLEAHDR